MTLNEFKNLNPEQFTVAVPETLLDQIANDPMNARIELEKYKFRMDVYPTANGYKFTVRVTRIDGTEREYGHNLYKYALAAAEYENKRKCVMNVEITMNF